MSMFENSYAFLCFISFIVCDCPLQLYSSTASQIPYFHVIVCKFYFFSCQIRERLKEWMEICSIKNNNSDVKDPKGICKIDRWIETKNVYLVNLFVPEMHRNVYQFCALLFWFCILHFVLNKRISSYLLLLLLFPLDSHSISSTYRYGA